MTKGTRIVLLGRQGSGKGTQCVRLSRHYVVPHISTGDMLRAAVRENSPLGRSVAEVIGSGGLVGDELIVEDQILHVQIDHLFDSIQIGCAIASTLDCEFKFVFPCHNHLSFASVKLTKAESRKNTLPSTSHAHSGTAIPAFFKAHAS